MSRQVKPTCRYCRAKLVWWDRDGWMPGVWVDDDVLDYDNSGEFCEDSPDEQHHPRRRDKSALLKGRKGRKLIRRGRAYLTRLREQMTTPDEVFGPMDLDNMQDNPFLRGHW